MARTTPYGEDDASGGARRHPGAIRVRRRFAYDRQLRKSRRKHLQTASYVSEPALPDNEKNREECWRRQHKDEPYSND
jgi:hypothetical protein